MYETRQSTHAFLNSKDSIVSDYTTEEARQTATRTI